VGGHGSHLIGDLSEANALIVVPEESSRVDPGSMVQVMVLDREF
jgi:molybdopterin molybdotransferase